MEFTAALHLQHGANVWLHLEFPWKEMKGKESQFPRKEPQTLGSVLALEFSHLIITHARGQGAQKLAWILIPLVNFSLFPGGSEASAMV